ncbi:MAG: adenylyltransferase/cytidyltransferase family protein [Proteobacteria bacterium]|nr:adenylyltransferase/cytidyltransferase family protein [Pseudomonadota bacterium]
MARRAIYIGRFQVFHLGHLDVLHTIDGANDVDEICLIIGSTQYDHRQKSPVATWEANPFTVEERVAMIEGSLKGQLTKPWSIHLVPDYHDWERWYQHIVDHLPAFQVLYSADRHEHAFFSAKGVETRRFPRRYSFHAGAVRFQLAVDDESWRKAVPQAAAEVLDRIGAGERMREMLKRDHGS